MAGQLLHRHVVVVVIVFFVAAAVVVAAAAEVRVDAVVADDDL